MTLDAKSQPRSLAIDQLKGLAIVCITLLHFEAGLIPQGINTWIGSFMISAFYFTSGWLMGLKGKEKLPTVRELACKRWRSLGLPYLWFSAIILLFDFIWILLGFDEWRLLGRDVYKTLTLRGIGTLWFLPALFFGELIFIWMIRKKLYWQLVALALTLVWYWGYGKWSADYAYQNDIFRIIDAPFRTIQNTMTAWPVILFSFYLSNFLADKMRKMTNTTVLIIGMMIACLSYFCANHLFSLLPQACGIVWGWFAPFWGPMALFLIFTSIQSLRINQFFTFWGKNSLILMATHYSIYQVVCEAFCERCLHVPAFVGWITIASFALTMAVEYPTVYIINRWFPILLGKRKENHA